MFSKLKDVKLFRWSGVQKIYVHRCDILICPGLDSHETAWVTCNLHKAWAKKTQPIWNRSISVVRSGRKVQSIQSNSYWTRCWEMHKQYRSCIAITFCDLSNGPHTNRTNRISSFEKKTRCPPKSQVPRHLRKPGIIHPSGLSPNQIFSTQEKLSCLRQNWKWKSWKLRKSMQTHRGMFCKYKQINFKPSWISFIIFWLLLLYRYLYLLKM